MKLEYDTDSDGAFLWLVSDLESRARHPDGAIKNERWPKDLDGNIGFMIGQDDRIIGVEVLFASSYLPKELLVDTYEQSQNHADSEVQT
jgi:uncharacterized protein YuzE